MRPGRAERVDELIGLYYNMCRKLYCNTSNYAQEGREELMSKYSYYNVGRKLYAYNLRARYLTDIIRFN